MIDKLDKAIKSLEDLEFDKDFRKLVDIDIDKYMSKFDLKFVYVLSYLKEIRKLSLPKKSWSERRVDAINRITKRKGYPASDNNPFFDEYIAIGNSKAKNKKEYKLERKKQNENNT